MMAVLSDGGNFKCETNARIINLFDVCTLVPYGLTKLSIWNRWQTEGMLLGILFPCRENQNHHPSPSDVIKEGVTDWNNIIITLIILSPVDRTESEFESVIRTLQTTRVHMWKTFNIVSKTGARRSSDPWNPIFYHTRKICFIIYHTIVTLAKRREKRSLEIWCWYNAAFK